MAKAIDLVGQRFGRLVVTERAGSRPSDGAARWRCKCDCGTETNVAANILRRGAAKSCGCLRSDIGLRNMSHGHTIAGNRSRTWRTWQSMIERCEVPRHKSFADYGGRGIAVCQRWHIFENFLADMGERPPGKTLDRINNDGSYEPGNCRWATPAEQANNRRKHRSPN